MTKQAEICLCSVEVESWMCFSQRHCPEWLESRWPVFCEHWQVSPLHWVCLAAPTKAEHTCRQPPVAAEAKREVRRHKAHVINHQSVTFSFELDLKQPTTWNWNKFNHSSCRAPFRGRFLFFRFCFGGLGGGGGGISFAGRMWVCWRAFAQRKCPTLSPGRRRLPDGAGFFHPLFGS